jgi:hypothetical protein
MVLIMEVGVWRKLREISSKRVGPLNSLVWYVPSLRYTRGQGWRIRCGVEVAESSTNKQNIISILSRLPRIKRATWKGRNPRPGLALCMLSQTAVVAAVAEKLPQ